MRLYMSACVRHHPRRDRVEIRMMMREITREAAENLDFERTLSP